MKKIFLNKLFPILILFLLLPGCKIKEYTPEIPSAFEQSAVVSSGDFSYECVICRKDGASAVTVTSTFASDLLMICDGEEITFSYSDFSYSVNSANFASSNCAVIIYEVFDYIDDAYQSGNLNVGRVDNGFKYEGEVSCGNFILLQNDDYTLNSLTFKNNDFSVTFS